MPCHNPRVGEVKKERHQALFFIGRKSIPTRKPLLPLPVRIMLPGMLAPAAREKAYQRLRKTMRPLLRSYGVSSTVTLSPVRMRM